MAWRWSIRCWCARRNAWARARSSIFRDVYFPAALPHIFTGLAVGMGVAWVSLIAAEMISGQFGIGYFTWEAYSLVQYADIALGMITIGVLGLGIERDHSRPSAALSCRGARTHMSQPQPKKAGSTSRDFGLRYDTLDGAVEAVSDVDRSTSIPASSSRSSVRRAAESRPCSTRSRASSSRRAAA